MILIALIILLLLLALVIIYVTHPLFVNKPETEAGFVAEDVVQKQEEYEGLLDRIRELDFDFSLGKLEPVEHEAQRAALLQQAAALRSELASEPAAQTSSEESVASNHPTIPA
ncbi:MAG TPA: hypothetical protein PLV27_06815 [Anaerolineaceae bacterium]|nr:hypothetical protein [Anaerolineaceae bacterium]